MSKAQREWWILFGICVAGKGADQTRKKLDAFLKDGEKRMRAATTGRGRFTPFAIVKWLVETGGLRQILGEHKMGQYQRINAAFAEAIKIDVTNLNVAYLEAIPGVGPKTARMVILYTDHNADCVPLDTHILKYLKRMCPLVDVPKSTPPAGIRYNELEAIFKELARRLNMTVRELDTAVWTAYHDNDLSKLPGLSNAKESAKAKD